MIWTSEPSPQSRRITATPGSVVSDRDTSRCAPVRVANATRTEATGAQGARASDQFQCGQSGRVGDGPPRRPNGHSFPPAARRRVPRSGRSGRSGGLRVLLPGGIRATRRRCRSGRSRDPACRWREAAPPAAGRKGRECHGSGVPGLDNPGRLCRRVVAAGTQGCGNRPAGTRNSMADVQGASCVGRETPPYRRV